MRTLSSRAAGDLVGDGWFKAARSSSNGTGCVEVNLSRPGFVALRDSKNPDGGTFVLTVREWRAFLALAAR